MLVMCDEFSYVMFVMCDVVLVMNSVVSSTYKFGISSGDVHNNVWVRRI